jgi:hypothetical protein
MKSIYVICPFCVRHWAALGRLVSLRCGIAIGLSDRSRPGDASGTKDIIQYIQDRLILVQGQFNNDMDMLADMPTPLSPQDILSIFFSATSALVMGSSSSSWDMI